MKLPRLVLAGMACAAVTAIPAVAASLPHPKIAASPAVGAATSAIVASADDSGALRVATPGAADQTFAVPPGCRPQAVAPGTVFVCTQDQGGPVSVDASTGALTKVSVGQLTPEDDREYFRLMAAGTQWLEGEMELTSDSSPSALTVPVIVNRATGAVVDTSGRFSTTARSWGARRYVDLSSARPDRTLCSPVRRSLLAGAGHRRYGRLVKVGVWTLREIKQKATAAGPSYLVQRCGSKRTLPLPAGAEPVLGRGYVAWFDRRVVRVRRLSDGHTRSYAWYRPGRARSATTIALSANRLLISQRESDGGPYRIYVIRLS